MSIQVFESHRAGLTGLAYRITGSLSEAEDIVQEAFLRWYDANHDTIHSPFSWLARVVTRLALDYLKSAKVRRETYIGPWLPEPFTGHGPEGDLELDESVSMALMVLLERLSAGERAAFILHDLFRMDFAEVAATLDKSAAACRKLASRAREKLQFPATQREDARRQPSRDQYMRLTSAFFDATKKGAMADLERLLKDDVQFHSDGGGKATAARRVIIGRVDVASFIIKTVGRAIQEEEDELPEFRHVWFNGAPGWVLCVKNQPVTAFSFRMENGLIAGIYALRNPDKLRRFRAEPFTGTSLN